MAAPAALTAPARRELSPRQPAGPAPARASFRAQGLLHLHAQARAAARPGAAAAAAGPQEEQQRLGAEEEERPRLLLLGHGRGEQRHKGPQRAADQASPASAVSATSATSAMNAPQAKITTSASSPASPASAPSGGARAPSGAAAPPTPTSRASDSSPVAPASPTTPALFPADGSDVPSLVRRRWEQREVKRVTKLIRRNMQRKVFVDALQLDVALGRVARKTKEPRRKIHSIDQESVWVETGWLLRHGKAQGSRKDRREQFRHMKKWFEFLDSDKSGGVGAEDLLDPLISLGLVQTHDDVVRLLRLVTQSESKEISFEDFIVVLQRPQQKRATGLRGKLAAKRKDGAETERDRARDKLANLFQKLYTGKLGDRSLGFPLLMTAQRRHMLLDANCAAEGTHERADGEAVLLALRKIKNPEATMTPPRGSKASGDPMFPRGSRRKSKMVVSGAQALVRKGNFKLQQRGAAPFLTGRSSSSLLSGGSGSSST